jgi:plasmid maintenance system antidote protein VapI
MSLIGEFSKSPLKFLSSAPGITAEMALKLGAALGTSQEVWLNAQEAVDLFSAGQLVEALPRRIRKAI